MLQRSRCSFQATSNLCDLFVHARQIKPTYDAFIASIATKTGGDARYADLKSMWRVAEKIVLRSPWEQRRAPDATSPAATERRGDEVGNSWSVTSNFWDAVDNGLS